MREFSRSFYHSTAWLNARETAMSRDGRLCVDCLKKGLYNPAVEVHHIQELTPENINDASIALGLDNLVSLCRDCHKARHKPQEERYTVDEYGRVTIK